MSVLGPNTGYLVIYIPCSTGTPSDNIYLIYLILHPLSRPNMDTLLPEITLPGEEPVYDRIDGGVTVAQPASIN